MNKRRTILVVIFSVLVVLSLFIGAANDILTLENLFKLDPLALKILYLSRIPRTLVVVLAASMLSISGMVMQALAKNKFISPQTAGTTDAATLGLLISYLLFSQVSTGVKFLFAFIFAMAGSTLFIYFIQKIKVKNTIYIPLIGLMYGAVISSVTTFLAQSTNALQVLNVFGQGGFEHISLNNIWLLGFLVPSLILIIYYANHFSIVSLGEEFATNLGIKYKFVLFIGLLVTSVVSASLFIVVGPLPFLGLIVPNLLSIYYGDSLKKNLIDLALFGSIFVLINDIFVRVALPVGELPISLTMGISGAIIFIVLLLRKATT